MVLKKILLNIFCLYSFVHFIGCEKNTLASSDYLDYQTIEELELPFYDEWFVVWGGRTLKQNYHASLKDQRFAIDVVQLENGSTFTGNGTRNEDYYCYGDTLFAPGSGQIVDMRNNVADNIPGKTNKKQLFGNYVIINHGNNEYSVLAHFMKNSIVVDIGDFVSQGQFIGLTGNSGNSTEPHLHYHLQNKPSISQGAGLPAHFQKYYADDVFVSIGEPVQNQTIRKD